MLSTIENKSITTLVSAYTNYSNGAPLIYLLNGLVQGTTASTRVGNAVRFTDLNVRINLAYGPTVTDKQTNSVRIMVIKEKPALGQTLSFTSLFDSAPAYTFTQFEMNDRDWKERFTILYDEVHLVNSQLLITEKNIQIKQKLNFVTSYARGNAGTIADIDTNSLFLVAIADSTTALCQYMRYSAQLMFQDA